MLKITFKDTEHKDFFMEQAEKCRTWDVYQKALMYVLGLSADCRNHINDLYDYQSEQIRPDSLSSGWQTSGSRRLIIFAFNLFNDFMAEEPETSPYSLFCDSNAPFFYQAIRVRYPEYTETDLYDIVDGDGNTVQESISTRFMADAYATSYQSRHGGAYSVVEHVGATLEI